MSVLACALCVPKAGSQSDSYVVSRQGNVLIQPSYQTWSDGKDNSISQYGTMLSVYLPLTREASLTVRAGHAITSGDVESLSGPTDIQLGLGWFLERLNLMTSLGVNVPTGKRELEPAQFVTSTAISNPILNFRYPILGQGLNINPGLAWVVPVSDATVLGLGGSYQYKAMYKPLAGGIEYDPGDEVLVTGGVDIQLDGSSNISLDAVFTLYGNDKVDGKESYASGSTIAGNLQYLRSFAQNELRIFTRYRSKGKSEIGSPVGLVAEPLKTEPNRFEAIAEYKIVFTPAFSMGFSLDGKIYEETSAFLSGATLFGFGIAPVFAPTPAIQIPVRLRAQFGKTKEFTSTRQLEFSLGVVTTF